LRRDMHKVIVERPRIRPFRASGHEPTRVLRHRAKRDPEGAPALAGMRRPFGGRFGLKAKVLNENLTPLRRFLEGSVGRRWDAVYSEIRARIHVSSAVQAHVLSHVRELVVEHAVIDGAVVWGCWSAPGVVGGWRPLRRGQLYVDSDDGVLCMHVRRSLRGARRV